MFDWNDIRYFLAVAQTGTFSAAARELRVSQSTVARRIREFEYRLGARLFDRVNQGYELTTAGKDIVHMAASMDRKASTIEQKVGGESVRLSGIVRLTTTEGLGACWLAERLPRFWERYPQIEIELVIGEGLVDLQQREADIALRIGTPGSEALVGRRLGCVGCGLYASQSYLAERGEPVSLNDLADHAVIESIGELAEVKQVRRLREVVKIDTVSMRSNSMLAQIAAVKAGLGVLPLPHFAVAGVPELRHVLPRDFVVSLDLWLLTHRDLKYTKRVRALLEYLKEEVRRDPPLLVAEN